MVNDFFCNDKNLLEDNNFIVFGKSGTGKTSKFVVPTIKGWKGPVLLYAVKGDINDDKFNTIDVSNIDNIITALRYGLSVLLLDTFENKMKRKLDDIFLYLCENDIGKPLLIVIDDYLALDFFQHLISLVRRARVKNIRFVISLNAASKEFVLNEFKNQYNELDLACIVENFKFIDISIL